MTSPEQRRILDLYSADVDSAFTDVMQRFGFRIQPAEIAPPDMWVMMKNRKGVELTIDFEWGGLLSVIVSKKPLLRFRRRHNVGPVIARRSPEGSVLYHPPFVTFDRDRVFIILKQAAFELGQFAPDVLEGDFSACQTSR